MAQNLTLIEAQGAGYIGHIRGTNSNVGMTIDIRNNSDEEITITAEPGTVIGSKDPNTQRMVISRRAAWQVPPWTEGSVTVDALCMEAHKDPPAIDVEPGTHTIDGIAENADVRKLLTRVEEVEAEISANITDYDSAAGTFGHTLQSPALQQLATASSYTTTSGGTAIQSQLRESAIQVPLWQITDQLGMRELAKIVAVQTPATQLELRQTAQELTRTVKLAEILLDEAGLSSKQSMHAPNNELEVLYLEHDLLSDAISRLRRELLSMPPGDGSRHNELRQAVTLLHDIEREIRIDPFKDELIDQLMRMRTFDTFSGRTSLLNGIRGDSLQREEGNKHLDLTGIVTQLTRHGRDDQGGILIVRLIDNALHPAEGFEVHPKLVALRQQFETAFNDDGLPT